MHSLLPKRAEIVHSFRMDRRISPAPTLFLNCAHKIEERNQHPTLHHPTTAPSSVPNSLEKKEDCGRPVADRTVLRSLSKHE
ncbi:hypothetical protein AVEN_34002-1 [Araneus ventricosus]|uniref:Uncharacterized protein n=1 Tax=Araneus ventricosus TaxID=182803 RepID=A0A4Y2E6T8_ARAVE|nr:hypothetical protein AVEN_34002-1 [Araneus ventricosus]